MKDWISQLDFAWVGVDTNGAVGIFYVPGTLHKVFPAIFKEMTLAAIRELCKQL